MAAYQFLDDQTTDTLGIKRTADGATIPPDPRNADWQVYLTWKAVPNTPDPATATTLRLVKKARKVELDRRAALEFGKELRCQLSAEQGVGFGHARLIEELVRYEADGSPSAADYPFLDALVGEEGVDLAAVATSIRTWWDGVSARTAAVFATVWAAHKDVNAAANKAAVDAVTPSWPAGDGGE